MGRLKYTSLPKLICTNNISFISENDCFSIRMLMMWTEIRGDLRFFYVKVKVSKLNMFLKTTKKLSQREIQSDSFIPESVNIIYV